MEDGEQINEEQPIQSGLNEDPKVIREQAARAVDDAKGFDRDKFIRDAAVRQAQMDDDEADVPIKDFSQPSVVGEAANYIDPGDNTPKPVVEVPPPAFTPKRPVTNPKHMGVDPKVINANRQARAKAMREVGLQGMPPPVDPKAAWVAKQRMEAGLPPVEIPPPEAAPQPANPEAAHKKLDDKLKVMPQGNDKDQQQEVLNAASERAAAEREFRRKQIEFDRLVTRQIQLDTAELQQIINGFHRSREGY